MKTRFSTGFLLFLVTFVQSVYGTELPTLQNQDGEKHNLKIYAGNWVVVNYWADWCPPCIKELPELVDFHHSNKQNKKVVVGINVDLKSTSKLADAMKKYKVDYPNYLGNIDDPKDGIVDVVRLPTTVILTPKGEVAFTITKGATREYLENIFDRLIPQYERVSVASSN